MRRVLLHICCGVCGLHSVEKLRQDGYYVEGFFYNPNIFPQDEYLKRKDALIKAGQALSLKVIEGKYDHQAWLDQCAKYKDEPEGKYRCALCYKLRLQETFLVCEKEQFDFFTSTLTISPHKNSKIIFELGKQIGGDKFLAVDFKKQDGFKKTMQMAKERDVYRQNYCGCEFSMNPR